MQPSLYAALADSLASDWRTKARPSQLAPPGDWSIWLQLAGRGYGKTRSGVEWTRQKILSGCRRVAIVAPTAADCRDVLVEGPSGFLATAPKHDRPEYEPSKRRLTWKSGATAALFSAEEGERLRGPEHDAAFCDELATWADFGTWDNLMFGLRIGRNPQCCVTTTPRPVKILRELLEREGKGVVITRGKTSENAANLSPVFLSQVVGKYQGTRLGRQELDGELLLDVPGALWQREWLDQHRVAKAPDLKRIVVAIDPAISNHEGSDETGVVIAGVGHDGHVYVLEDASGRYAPHEWAQRAIVAYRAHKADRIIAEVNQGGLMVQETIRTIDRDVPYRAVHASRGKVTRAEPVSALYEQGKVHHVGQFAELEDQLCSFSSDFDRGSAGYSPDRLDALVWAVSELAVKPQGGPAGVGYYGRQSDRPSSQPHRWDGPLPGGGYATTR
ncbi:MAG: ATP-binding protein [Rhizobium sp.]|nr:ATP-binding protein [Rhizobium sp.]